MLQVLTGFYVNTFYFISENMKLKRLNPLKGIEWFILFMNLGMEMNCPYIDKRRLPCFFPEILPCWKCLWLHCAWRQGSGSTFRN